MFKKIIEESIQYLSKNHKLIRISFVTTFSHSLTVVALLLYNINTLLHYRFHSGLDYNTMFNFLMGELKIVVIVVAIGAIGYELLYPIGQAAMIRYLNNDDQRSSKAFGQGLERFFPMLEYINLLMLFNGVTIITTFMRLSALEIGGNPIILTLMAMRTLCTLVTGFLWPYIKYAINIEDMNLSDAINYSVKLSRQNISITFKFFVLEGVLIVRFFLNILVILGLPLLLIYLANRLNILGKTTNTIITAMAIGLIVATAYLNAIVEAFFTTYWFKVYKTITEKKEE